MATCSVQPLGRYAFIDHLRGFAALSVLVFHAFGPTAGTPIWAPLEPLRAVALHGWHGVHVFFVISGYCITEKIHSLASRGQGAGAFLHDRFWRIVPPYWATLAVCVLIGLAAAPFNGLPLSSALPPSLPAALGDLALLQPLLQTSSLLLVSWTLVYEAGFYLIAAGLFALQPALGDRSLITGGTLLAAVCLALPSSLTGGLLAQWPEFWLGMFAHFVLANRCTALGAGVLAGLAALAIFNPFGMASALHVSALVTAVVLIFSYRYDRQLAKWSGLRWVGVVGVWSYSLYLMHAPILSRSLNLGARFASPESWNYAVVLALALAAALLAAWSFARFVERPLEAWRRGPRIAAAAQSA